MTTRHLLRAAGLLVWAFAGIPATLHSVGEPTFPVWAGAFLVFGLVFFRASSANAKEGREPTRLLALQALAALVMNTVLCTGFEVALLVVVAVQLGLLMPLSRALPWLAVQCILAFALASHHMGLRAGGTWSIAVVGITAFAFTIATMAGREAAARRELESTRGELARATRDAERLRIARDLHDLLGHDLIALHLELETARHLAQGDAKKPVERAHDVAKTLLADLRKAVSSLREESSDDVAKSIRAFAAKVTEPCIHFDGPESLEVADAERSNALVRAAQEIVTNAIKHASARNLWIELAAKNGTIELAARDDGRGAASFVPGNGLSGMRERLEKLGGELVVESAEGTGFRVRATLPSERSS